MRILDRTTEDLRRAGDRARGRIAGRRTGPGWLGAVAIGVAGAAAGAVTAFLSDPARGRARRAQLLDRSAAAVRRAGRDAGRAMHAVAATAEGRLQAITEAGTRVAPTDDVTLRDRAESQLFRDPSVPKGQINISAERGILVLRGEVPDADMRDRLGREAEGIDGVWSVHNLLHLPGEAAEQTPMAGVTAS
jgi:BON domain